MGYTMNGDNVQVMAALGLTVILGYAAGQLIRRVRLPAIIGYLLLGVLLGPSGLGVLGHLNLEKVSFITDLALGFVAFSIGTELRLRELRKQGVGIAAIIIAESLCAFGLVTAGVFALTRNLPTALVFGAVAPATAPAGTVAVIQEYKAKGSLSRAMYAVAGFDDGLAIVIFGFASAFAVALLAGDGEQSTSLSLTTSILIPLREIGLSLLLGVCVGFVYGYALRFLRSGADNFAVHFGIVLLVSGLALEFHLSLILANMAVGFVLSNTRRTSTVKQVTVPALTVLSLIFILFFGIAGAHLELTSVPALGLIGLTYLVMRTAGKIIGVRLGAMVGNLEAKIKRYLGLGILSQAGVAIGLSLLLSKELAELGPAAAAIGSTLITTITATCIIFEIIGPIAARFALSRAGEITEEVEKDRYGKRIRKPSAAPPAKDSGSS